MLFMGKSTISMVIFNSYVIHLLLCDILDLLVGAKRTIAGWVAGSEHDHPLESCSLMCRHVFH